RGGERRPVTIDDGPALRVQDDGAGVLTLGERGQLGVADDLQLEQASHEASERDGEDRRDDEHARSEAWKAQRTAASIRAWCAAATPLPPATYSRASRTCWRAGAVRPSWRARDSTRPGERSVASSTSSCR